MSWDTALRRWGLHAGVVLGLGMALLGLRPGVAALPADAVASINGMAITRAQWQQALDAVAADRTGPLTEQDRRRVLDRLIDEELLLQYAVELDLVRSVAGVRTSLVGAVLQSQVADADAQTPATAVLRDFYRDNRAYFARRPALRIRGWRFDARPAAASAAAALRHGAAPSGGEPMPLPDSALDAGAWRTYLGATLAALVDTLPAGTVTDPQAVGRAWYVLRVDERVEDDVPPFDAIADQVLSEWRRREAEARVQTILDQLRARGEINVRRSL